MLAAEARFMLKLKNSNDNGLVVDGSLLEDVVMGIGAGAMDSNSPNVGTSDNDNDNDIRCCHLEGQLFWVQMLKLNILMPSLLDLFDMSTAQRNFVSHYYSAGGDGGVVGSGSGGGRHAHGEGNSGEEEAEEDNDGFSSSGGSKR